MDADSLALKDALERHLAENGFSPDGGLNEKWVAVRFGPLPLCFPNVAIRRRAVPAHDLNHVVSGYGHDDLGEAEIGAWELGSGCKGYLAAWVLNWSALPLGWRSPRRMLAAFARGRHTRNLYGTDLNSVLDLPVGVVRSELGLDGDYRTRPSDIALLIAMVVSSPVIGLVPGMVSLATSPWWLRAGTHRRSREIVPPAA